MGPLRLKPMGSSGQLGRRRLSGRGPVWRRGAAIRLGNCGNKQQPAGGTFLVPPAAAVRTLVPNYRFLTAELNSCPAVNRTR